MERRTGVLATAAKESLIYLLWPNCGPGPHSRQGGNYTRPRPYGGNCHPWTQESKLSAKSALGNLVWPPKLDTLEVFSNLQRVQVKNLAEIRMSSTDPSLQNIGKSRDGPGKKNPSPIHIYTYVKRSF
uniref:Uncharacterized protein n=1 Tax=Oryza rufipogon TaxID=4529 RepID=A0A0E0NGU3_ORYRU